MYFARVKMSEKLFAVFAIVSYVFLSICKINVSSAEKLPSISENIKSDKAICATRNVFVESNFAKDCEKVNFPTRTNVTLIDGNIDQFLCLGLYDRIWRICFLSSTSAMKNLPENTTTFDLGVKKFFPKDPIDILTFCNNWKSVPSAPKYKTTEPFVAQLDEALKKLPACIKMCANMEGELKPICAVLASIDEISKNDSAAQNLSALNSQEGSSKQIKQNVSEGKNAERPKDKVKIEIVTEKKENISDKNVEASKKSTNIVAVVKQSPSAQNDRNAQEKNSVPQAEKQAADQAVAPQPPKASDKKIVETNKAKIEISKNSPDKKAEENSDVAKNARIDSPLTGEEQASATHVESNEQPDQISLLENDRGDRIADDIAERTEDNDQLAGGGDPSDDANEIESPIMPASNDDANDNHPQTSDKRGYVPRIPGMSNDDDSHLFGYFTVIGVICIAGYVGYHNKQKIFAMLLEGRRSRGGRGRRRPSTANYRKLDCTLEEAVTSQCNSNVTHVIY